MSSKPFDPNNIRVIAMMRNGKEQVWRGERHPEFTRIYDAKGRHMDTLQAVRVQGVIRLILYLEKAIDIHEMYDPPPDINS